MFKFVFVFFMNMKKTPNKTSKLELSAIEKTCFFFFSTTLSEKRIVQNLPGYFVLVLVGTACLKMTMVMGTTRNCIFYCSCKLGVHFLPIL